VLGMYEFFLHLKDKKLRYWCISNLKKKYYFFRLGVTDNGTKLSKPKKVSKKGKDWSSGKI
jgi:hypothetical protein